jgi:thiol-disulfide isomerase/thioredoxin
MKKILLLLSVIFLTSCANEKKEKNETTEVTESKNEITSEYDDEILLLGRQTRSALQEEPYKEWFEENYSYEPDAETLKNLSKNLDNISFIVFMGTWCEDSQLHTPALYKIFDLLEFPENRVRLIAVSRDKNTPQGLEDDFNLEYVPTIIIYEYRNEIGRIVEWPVETIEKDMLAIITGQDYKHTYAD